MASMTVHVDEDISKFTVHGIPDRPGVAAELFGQLGSEGINIHMMAASGAEAGRTDISLTVSRGDSPRAAKLLQEVGDAQVVQYLVALEACQCLAVFKHAFIHVGEKY